MSSNISVRYHSRAGAPPRAQVTREDFTKRLGLPADATNEQVFAAVDAAKARTNAPSAEEATYARLYGSTPVSGAAEGSVDVFERAYPAQSRKA